MTDRPILFSAPMVRAQRDDRKTQTRRQLYVRRKLVPGRPVRAAVMREYFPPAASLIGIDEAWDLSGWQRCVAGDRLWVREAWRVSPAYDDLRPADMSGEETVFYEADYKASPDGRLRAAMHMPRWASRLTWLVTSTRIERLQDISEADARAEGAMRHIPVKSAVSGTTIASDSWHFDVNLDGRLYEDTSASGAYEILWGKINGWDSWDANPWVVVITGEIVKENIDAIPEDRQGRSPDHHARR